MDKFSEIFNLLLHTNTINFLVFMAIIIVIAKAVDIPSMLEKMCANIRSKIDESEKSRTDALEDKSKALKSCENTEQEISEIIAAATDRAKALSEEVSNDTDRKIQNIKANAQKIINNEANALTSTLISNIGLKSVEAAKNKLIDEIQKNDSLHYKFIDESLEELDKAVLNDIL